MFYDQHQHENGVSVLYATETAIVYAYAPANGLMPAVKKLKRGEDPAGLLPDDAVAIKFDRVSAIEQNPRGDGIVIRHRYGRRITSTVCTGHREMEIAKTLAKLIGITSSPTTRLATFREVSFLPGAIMAMAAPFAAILIGVALTWDPAEVDMNRGKVRMFSDVMEALGAAGVCILASIPVLAVTVWWVVAYIQRPTVTMFRRYG